MKISEPAADLAVAAALVSSLTDVPVPLEAIVFGEIGLSGEIRPVSQSGARLKEAEKLGFDQAVTPRRKGQKTGRKPDVGSGLIQTEIGHLQDLLIVLSPRTTGSPFTAVGGGA